MNGDEFAAAYIGVRRHHGRDKWCGVLDFCASATVVVAAMLLRDIA
jgi:hypothetical protein